LVVHFQDSQLWETLETGVEILIAVAAQNVVDLELAQGAMVV
jgi:hypothetical protein